MQMDAMHAETAWFPHGLEINWRCSIMKKSVRLISILMAMVLCFSCMTTGVWAEYSDYSHPAGTNALDRPVISVYQCGSMILDKIDAMLAKMDEEKDGKLHGSIGWPLNVSYDLRSIDGALRTVHSLVDSGILDLAIVTETTVGDLDNIRFGSLIASPYRTTVGSTDLQIIYAMCNFLKDNINLIGKVVDGQWDNGMIGRWLDINDIVGDVQATIKKTVFKALFMEDDKVKPGTVVTETSTLDAMVNEFLYSFIGGDSAIFDTLVDEMDKGGAAHVKDAQGKDLPFYDFTQISVYSIIRYVLRAAISQFATPLLTDLLSGNTDMLVPLLTGLLDIEVPEDLEGDALVAYLVNNILDLRGGALSKFIRVTDDGISLTPDFQTLLRALLDTAQGLMGSLTSYDTVAKWTADEVAELSEPEMMAYLVRTVLTSMIDYMDIPLTMPVRNDLTGEVLEKPINGYALATYTLINIMADKMPEVDYYGMIENYKNGATTGDVLNPGFVPQTKYDEPAAFTVLSDYMYYYLNAKTTMAIPADLSFDQTLQWIFNWVLDQFGGLLRTDNLDLTTTPTATNMVVWKNMDILLWNNVLNITWLPDDCMESYKENGQYTGNVTRSLLLDNLLYTIVNLDLTQLDGMLKLFNTYQGTNAGYPSKEEGELNQNVIKFVLILVKRLLNGMFQGENKLFNNTTINCLEDIVSKTKYSGKTNLRWIVENLGNLLATYAEPILTSALPLVAKSLANLDEYAENYDIYPPENSSFGISDLRNRLNAQQPSNELNEDMLTNEDYFFFGSEDFNKENLYKFYNWRKVFREANSLSEDYEEDWAKLNEEWETAKAAYATAKTKWENAKAQGKTAEEIEKLYQAVTDQQAVVDAKLKAINDYKREIAILTYRLDYYYNQLVYRAVDASQLQREYAQAKAAFGYGNYGSLSANGTRYSSQDFTRKTWNDYNDALNFAKNVLMKAANDPSSVRQSMISAARELLIVAEKQLKFFSGDADYSELIKLIQMARAKIAEFEADNTTYDAQSIADLDTATAIADALDRGYDSSGQSLIDDAVAALQAAYDDVIELPQIAKAIGSTTVLDKSRMVVYGMREKLENYLAYVRNRGTGILDYEYTSIGNGTGTGAKIGLKLTMEGNVVQSYTVIIFGDVDGDCRCDGADANWVYRYKANLINKTVPDYVLDAADVNADGVVDTVDAYYLRQSGIQKYSVSQRGVV